MNLNYTGDSPFNVNCLDHGYVALRNVSGPTPRPDQLFDADDVDIAQAARYSFGDARNVDRTREQDVRLMQYLVKNRHTSPVEMLQLWFEFKLPIFVARQFMRHRMGTFNEVSGRYVQLPPDWYIPSVVGAKPNKETGIKQGQVDNLDESMQQQFKILLNAHCQQGYETYERALQCNVAPEHARMLLSLNHYTVYLWKVDLHNLMGWMKLRRDPHAQAEAQVYANAVYNLVKQHLPEAINAFDELF